MSDLRKHFPIFSERLDNEGIVYLDSAATTLKPKSVIDAVSEFYLYKTSNVFRGNSLLAEEAGLAFREAREDVASFLRAQLNEIVFTHNCTDSINLVCAGLPAQDGDEVIVSILEHHSNFIPWAQKFSVKIVPTDGDGQIDLDSLKKAISSRTKLIAVTHASNVTGNIQPIKEIVRLANEHGIMSLIDVSQTISHEAINVKELGCSFLCFSSHKMFGPSGVGVLYGKQEALNALQISRFGGGMVSGYSHESGPNYKEIPFRFESGTPNIEGVLGLARAIRFISQISFPVIQKQNSALEKRIQDRFSSLSNVRRLFPLSQKRVPIVTFCPTNDDMDINYAARILADKHGLILTAGLQCASPLYSSLGRAGGIRASFHAYNTVEEVDKLAEALEQLSWLMG
jgi:cysteine desulfurase/selenocysteine lyase